MSLSALFRIFQPRKSSSVSTKTALGNWGEEEAVRYLQRSGYKIDARNWRIRMGEIDIIARKGREVVFVEVKTGSGISSVTPERRVGIRKQQKIRALAQIYLRGVKEKAISIRFDVISIWREGNETKLQHFENAF